jgi:hypothetical protein
MAYNLTTDSLLRSEYFGQEPVAPPTSPRGTVLDMLDRFEFDKASPRPLHTSRIIAIARRIIGRP